MSLINTEIKPFQATAYHNGEFVQVSNGDFEGQWSVASLGAFDQTIRSPQSAAA